MEEARQRNKKVADALCWTVDGLGRASAPWDWRGNYRVWSPVLDIDQGVTAKPMHSLPRHVGYGHLLPYIWKSQLDAGSISAIESNGSINSS
jgi:hypothetical protein